MRVIKADGALYHFSRDGEAYVEIAGDEGAAERRWASVDGRGGMQGSLVNLPRVIQDELDARAGLDVTQPIGARGRRQ